MHLCSTTILCFKYSLSPQCGARRIANDRSKEFHWKFNRPVAAKMIHLQNPLLRFHKTTKGNFSGEDFQISPMVSFLDDSDSLAQIMSYYDDTKISGQP